MATESSDITYEILEEFTGRKQFQTGGEVRCRRYLLNGLYREDFSHHDFKALRNMEVYDSDVFLCTYMRAGTTLTQRIMLALRDDKKYSRIFEMFEVFPFIEMNMESFRTLEVAAKLPSPRWFKTHLFVSAVPRQIFEKKVRLIHVYRSCAEVIVSTYYFYKTNGALSNLVDEDFTFEKHFDRFMKGYSSCGCWFRYQKDWFDYVFSEQGRSHCLVISYKELTQKKEEMIRKLASFIGIEASKTRIERALLYTTPESMKAEFADTVAQVRNAGRKEEPMFTAEQSAVIETKCREILGNYANLVL